jgi:SAM-dependent methyltransferase
VRSIYDGDYALAGAAPRSDAARARAYCHWIQNECSPPRSILEIGCGSGALLRELLAAWPDAKGYGIDPALSDVDRSDNRIRLERGFVEDIPETLRGFDLIIAVNVIEHLPSPDKFISSLRSRLAPNGSVVIVCPAVDPPNVELLFFDHIYSLTTRAINSAAGAASLVVREGAPAPQVIGDFQMVVLADRSPTVSLRQKSLSDLWSERQFYFEQWSRLDLELLNRSKPASRLVAFGGGQTAALLRAYAPRAWERVELIVLDEASEAWSLGKPIASYQNAVQNLQMVGALIATAPRTQKLVAERLRRDGLYPIIWDDVIAN